MANEQKIDEIIDRKAFDQLDKLKKELGLASEAFEDMAMKAADAANAFGKSNPQNINANFEKAKKAAADTLLAEEKLRAFREKAAAQQQIIEDRATASAAKREAAEKKKLEADEKAIAALERKRKAQFMADDEASNGATILTGTLVNAKEQTDALAASQSAASSATNQNTKATKENANEKKRLTFEALQAQQAEKDNATTLKNSVKEANAAKGSLEQRQLALARLQKTYSQLTVEERNSPFGQRLAKTIPQLNEQVLELEKNIGKSQRNVGNYGSAFGRAANQAFNGLKTIANILPGLGLAGLIGFAIEPIMDYIKGLDMFKKKIGEIAAETAAMSSEYKKAVSDVTSLKTSIDEFHSGTISKTELVKRYNETIGQTVGELKTAAEVENWYNQQAANFIKATLMKAEAQAALNVATEKNSEALKRQVEGPTWKDYAKSIGKAFVDTFAGVNVSISGIKDNAKLGVMSDVVSLKKESKEAADEYGKLQKKADDFAKSVGLNFRPQTKKDVKEAQKAAEKLEELQRKKNAAIIAADIETVKQQQQIYKDNMDNENFSYDSRIDALNHYTERSKTIVELEAKKEKAAKKLSAEEIAKIYAEKATKIQEIEKKHGESLRNINKQTAKQNEEIRKFTNEKEIAELEKRRDDELTVLADAYNKKGDFSQKSQEEYEKKRLEIVNKYAIEEVSLALDQAQKLLDIKKASGQDITKDEAALSALRLKQQDLITKNAEDNAKKQIQTEKEKAETLKQLYQETFEFAKSVTNSIFEGNIQNIEKEKEAIDEKKNSDIEAVNESLLSEQEKADKIAIINAQADAQQKQIDERVKREKIKQAKADKIFALSQVAINTAIAVSKVWGQTGIFGLAAQVPVLVMGALQAAAILATPIPKYKHGTDNHPKDGLAIVGDGGMSELMIRPDGSMELSPDKPTLTFLEKGSKVFDGEKTLEILKNMPIKAPILDVEHTRRNEWTKVADGLKRVEKAITNQKQYGTILTSRGLRGYMASQKNIDTWLFRNGIRRR